MSGSALDALAEQPRWVAWRIEDRNGKPTKIPYSPQGGMAKADDPSTWGLRTAAEARAAEIANGKGGGVGIQLGELGDDTFLAGVDLDSCLDDDGEIAAWAATILSALPSYAEKSPSGRGIKLWFCLGSEDVRPFLDRLGVKPDSWGCRRDAPGEDARDHGPAIEVYLNKRYFAVTGDRLPEMPNHLATLDRGQLERLAGAVPAVETPELSSGNGSDNSRSAQAFRMGLATRRAGKTYDEFCEAVRTDPDTASWYAEKGILDNGRELHRVWERAEAKDHGLDLVRASDIIPQPVRWLWPGRIARGKVTIVAGDPGVTKSQLALWIAANVTSAGPWPVVGTKAELGSVIIFSAEDATDDTIRPRLEAAGADLDRCLILRESGSGFSLDRDLPKLEKALAAIDGVVLVIIDPISAYLGSINSHNNAQVRGLLGPLSNLAARCGVAVLAVSHLSKSGEGEAISRVSGSIGFVAAARAAYMVIRDPEDAECRLFLPLKNNLGDDRTGYAYSVEPVTLPSGIETSRIAWSQATVTVAVDELLASRRDAPARTKLEFAELWLWAELDGGPVPQKQIEARAKAAGYSWATVRRAKDRLGIVPEKTGFDGGWVWGLPERGSSQGDNQ
jgi:hypothetical protein